jgi:hypothetical protein
MYVVEYEEYQVTRNMIVGADTKRAAHAIVKAAHPAARRICAGHTVNSRKDQGQDLIALGYQVGDVLEAKHTWS